MKLILNPDKDNVIKKIWRWFKPSPYLCNDLIIKNLNEEKYSKLFEFTNINDSQEISFVDFDDVTPITSENILDLLEETKDIIILEIIMFSNLRYKSLSSFYDDICAVRIFFYNQDDYAWFRLNGLV